MKIVCCHPASPHDSFAVSSTLKNGMVVTPVVAVTAMIMYPTIELTGAHQHFVMCLEDDIMFTPQ